jgi:hypothetical protein
VAKPGARTKADDLSVPFEGTHSYLALEVLDGALGRVEHVDLRKGRLAHGVSFRLRVFHLRAFIHLSEKPFDGQ